MITPAEALSRIPGWGGNDVACTELKGGLTNRIFLVELERHKSILRLDAQHTAAFDLDRPRELVVLERAAGDGIAPDVIFSDVEAGILLSAFVVGRTWETSDLDDHENLEALSALLHQVHALPICGSAFDASRVARRYLENLTSDSDLHAFGVRCLEIIDGIEGSGVTCCCHNDIVVENVISASRLMLIDWEYACDNDPLFDLASLIAYHDLSDKKAQDLLSAYAGGANRELAEQLQQQVRLYDAMQWLWLAIRHMITGTADQAARLDELQQRMR